MCSYRVNLDEGRFSEPWEIDMNGGGGRRSVVVLMLMLLLLLLLRWERAFRSIKDIRWQPLAVTMVQFVFGAVDRPIPFCDPI